MLKASGFAERNLVLMHDDQKGRYYPFAKHVRGELKLLLAGLDKAATVVVAFSGHGVQFKNDPTNYFCPLDTRLQDRTTLVSLAEIYKQLDGCAAARKLLLVDACRNDPQSEVGKSVEDFNLASVSKPQAEPTPKGIKSLFGCSANQRSYEWPDLGHGIFFHYVIEGWKGPAASKDGTVTPESLTTYVKDETKAFARLKLRESQIPASNGGVEGEWVLSGGAAVVDPFCRDGERTERVLRGGSLCNAASNARASNRSRIDAVDARCGVRVALRLD